MRKPTLTLAAASLAVLLAACGDRETQTAPSAPATTAPPPVASPSEPTPPPAGTTAPDTSTPSGTSSVPPAPSAEAGSSAAAAPSDVAGAPAAVAGGGDLGAGTYNKACALCHAAGVGGAPKPGDTADWGPRIAQGKDVLYKHAIEGFTGQKGMMPPRGGNPALKDEDVKAAVDFMVSKSQ